MRPSVHVQALRRAAEIMGGPHQLRAYLRVSTHQLEAWMEGTEKPPTDIFLKVVDVISGQTNDERSDLLRQSREVRERAAKATLAARTSQAKAAEVLKRSTAARQHSLELCAALLTARVIDVAKRPEISAADFLRKEFAPSEGPLMLASALNAAVNDTAAPRGNIQLADKGGLCIVAHLGFEQPFLQFFDTVSHQTPSACGRAHESGQRTIVADVVANSIFTGTAACDVMQNARALACQSTPLMGDSGEVIGMLSTHYEKPHQPSPEELATLDLICQRASFWLAGRFE